MKKYNYILNQFNFITRCQMGSNIFLKIMGVHGPLVLEKIRPYLLGIQFRNSNKRILLGWTLGPVLKTTTVLPPGPGF